MTAREVLDGIKARLAAGVHPGERWTSWPELTMDSIIMHRVYDEQRRCVAECSSPDVAEVLAASPTDVARLTGAVEAVLALHAPDVDGDCDHCRVADGGYVEAPCPTVRAIENALDPT